MFKSPDKILSKKEKINNIVSQIFNFCTNEKLIDLIHKFDKDVFMNEKDFDINNIQNIVDTLCEFSFVWDYRRKQNTISETGERARWLLQNDEKIEKIEPEILAVAKELGFIGKTLLYEKKDFRYLLVLGGAKESNILRPKYSKMIIDKYDLKNVKVVGLACDRKFENIENETNFKYPNNVQTEFDAMQYGICKAYNIPYENLQMKNNIWETLLEDENLYVLNAPSSDSSRRANSADTFEFFLKTIYDKKDDNNNICLITSQLFVPYQSMGFMEYAIENDIYFDIVGYPYEIYDPTLNYTHAKGVKYLQEIRGTLLSINKFINKFYKN